MSTTGKFVWYDLLTRNPDAATAFYTHAIGWGVEQWSGPEPYTMFTAEGTAVGGVMNMPAEVSAPPHWLGYVETPDIAATTRRVGELGGTVMRPPTDIPGVGRFSVIADPQQAAFALFEPSQAPELADPSAPGAFGWAELNTSDWEAAWQFYSRLFGWQKTSAMEMEGFGTYFMFKGPEDAGERSMGGMSNAATMMGAPPHWLFYTTVVDLEAALARTKERGGRVLNGPMPVPGGDAIAQCMDPQGGAFALYQEGVAQK